MCLRFSRRSQVSFRAWRSCDGWGVCMKPIPSRICSSKRLQCIARPIHDACVAGGSFSATPSKYVSSRFGSTQVSESIQPMNWACEKKVCA